MIRYRLLWTTEGLSFLARCDRYRREIILRELSLRFSTKGRGMESSVLISGYNRTKVFVLLVAGGWHQVVWKFNRVQKAVEILAVVEHKIRLTNMGELENLIQKECGRADYPACP